MKAGIILSPFSIGNRVLSFQDIWNDRRGLSGTDLSLLMISKGLLSLSHDVSIFTIHSQEQEKLIVWEGIKLYNYSDMENIVDDSYDILISLNEPDVFRNIKTKKPKRICYQFLNDLWWCQDNFNDYVDQWITVSHLQKDHLLKQAPQIRDMEVIPLGCSPEKYSDQRVKGRIVWTSSGDRGLFHLLSIFSYIKANVDFAHLRIFYHYPENEDQLVVNPNDNILVQEMTNRLIYNRDMIKELKGKGVERIGSISYNQMIQEMNEASVFAFPCCCAKWSEGFSISTLSSLASFTAPIISSEDALKEVYHNSGTSIIPSPIRNNLKQFADEVIKCLTDDNYANEKIEKCREFSLKLTWENTVKMLEDIMLQLIEKDKK